MLKIFYTYHNDEGSLKTYENFLRLLRKVFPCECSELMKENKKDIKSQIKAIKNCVVIQKGLSGQKYKAFEKSS